MAWGVTDDLLPLAPGQSLTLITGDASYDPAQSVFTTPIATDSPIYAQVDSWSPFAAYGAVLEADEVRGGVYNNIAFTVNGAPAVLWPSASVSVPVSESVVASQGDLPARPR